MCAVWYYFKYCVGTDLLFDLLGIDSDTRRLKTETHAKRQA
jgi:hypothetical protein